MNGLASAVVALAITVLASGVVFFVIKYGRHRWQRARDLRRAIYINTIGELVARSAIPNAQLDGWRRDPVFMERLIDAVDVFDGAQREHLLKLAEEIGLVDDLVGDLRHRRPGRRLDAATALARLARPELVAPLTAALHDSVIEVRVEAANALARIGAPESVGQILRRMEDEEPWSAILMADALIQFGPSAVPQVAAEVLMAQPQIEGRSRHLPDLVRTLGAIGDPSAEPALAHALASSDAVVRLRAAEALGRAGTPRSVKTLLRSLSDDDWRVRSKAAEALGSQGDESAAEALLDALRDPEWWVRQHAAEALAKLPDGASHLMRALDDEDAFARDAAIERLTLMGAVRRARKAGPGDELHDRLAGLGRLHLLESA